MDGKRFLRTIRLENILSYGPDSTEFELLPLNVLIGPNASGKSNLIEALSLLEAAPQNLQRPIQVGGGTREWLWKGVETYPVAVLEATMNNPQNIIPIEYQLSFTGNGFGRFALQDERIENSGSPKKNEKPNFYYRYQEGSPVLNARVPTKGRAGFKWQEINIEEHLSHEQSVLSQIRDPEIYPELFYLANQFQEIAFYRDWDFGHYSSPRNGLPIDIPSYYLREDASNLGLVLANLISQPNTQQKILDHLKNFYPQAENLVTSIEGGTVQINLYEKDLQHPVPLTRLSDGTLRYLSLLTILCHPDPPPVTCIEEPELGLHPDIIPEVAKLLIDASARSQIITTTHSDILVDALTEIPESIIVCEKLETSTQLKRLEPEKLKHWLEDYRLGDLWISGKLGGNRW